MARINVLWEDQLAAGAPPKQFGPNVVLVACLCDRLASRPDDWFKKRRELMDWLRPIPLKGNGNVLARCEEWLRRDHPPFAAILDQDKLAKLLGLPGDSGSSDMVTKFRERCGADRDDGRLTVLLLDRNVESLVSEAAAVLGVPDQRKDRVDRDMLLGRLADESGRARRDELLKRLPSLSDIVDSLLGLRVEVALTSDPS